MNNHKFLLCDFTKTLTFHEDINSWLDSHYSAVVTFQNLVKYLLIELYVTDIYPDIPLVG